MVTLTSTIELHGLNSCKGNEIDNASVLNVDLKDMQSKSSKYELNTFEVKFD